MKSFRDSEGRPWEIRVNVGAVQRVRDVCNVDLTELAKAEGDAKPVGVRLTTEPIFVAEVLFALVGPQATAKGVTKDAFFEALDGDALAKAFDCFTDELIAFFQSGNLSHQATALQAQMRVLVATAAAAKTRLENLDIPKLIESQFSRSAGSWPELPESTPPTERSES